MGFTLAFSLLSVGTLSMQTKSFHSRRDFLGHAFDGLGMLALSDLLRAETTDPFAPRLPHFPRKAKRCIFLFMQGGVSQMDSYEYKPLLNKYHGKRIPNIPALKDELKGRLAFPHACIGSPFKFQKYGQSERYFSELLPHLSEIVDDIMVIRSMRTGVNNHGQSIHAMNSGRTQSGRPALGSWLTYALGAATTSLPAYVAMTDPKGLPVEGVLNWSNGWLPSLFQGTVIRPVEPRILNLQPPQELQGKVQENYLRLLGTLNRQHFQQRSRELELQARLVNLELATQMQTSAQEALDVGRETMATHRMYGLDNPATQEFGTRCLIARRLVERGVRFVPRGHTSVCNRHRPGAARAHARA